MNTFDLKPLVARFDFLVCEESGVVVPAAQLLEVAQWLKKAEGFCCDMLSNVTGVDYLPKEIEETLPAASGQEGAQPQTVKRLVAGYVEVVYHLYSVALVRGPLVLKVRVPRELDACVVPSLVGLYRSADFQEREIYDLYGVRFEGHPDLRRLLMWEGFEDHPMRKDYVAPADEVPAHGGRA